MQIECIGAIRNEPLPITESTLNGLLTKPVAINHQGDFFGKPGTRLYASEELVLKRPCDESMSAPQAVAWCRRQLERERVVGGYHPARTWIAFCKYNNWAVANVTPRLPTLEQLLLGPLPSSEKLTLLLRMFECFFATYAHSEVRQDEGLRNYVVDKGEVWYIDDDLYRHDNLTAFSASLGSYVRALDWLNAPGAFHLGDSLRQHISVIDRSLVDSVYRGFADTFLPQKKERIRKALLKGLCKRHPPRGPAATSRIAVLADIHGNLPALDAVLADCRERKLMVGIVLGDIVGYGPNPGECVERVRASGYHALMGNHDQTAGLGKTPGSLSRAAHWSAPWTYQALTDKQRHWLRSLPPYFHNRDYYAVHGAPQDPTFMNAYVYARTAQSNLDYMRSRDIQLCLHGHSHIPGVWHRDRCGEAVFSCPASFSLKTSPQTLVCPGSVGQARNGDCRAQYLILDLEKQSIDFVQVPYNHQELITQMQRMEFPDYVINAMVATDNHV